LRRAGIAGERLDFGKEAGAIERARGIEAAGGFWAEVSMITRCEPLFLLGESDGRWRACSRQNGRRGAVAESHMSTASRGEGHEQEFFAKEATEEECAESADHDAGTASG